jgi:uncharacterized protein
MVGMDCPPALNAAVIVIGMMVVSNVVAQSSSGYILPGTEQHIVTSERNDTDYQIMVSLPEGYDENRETGYPVFYILDGNLNFPLAVQTQRVMTQYGIAEPVIVVGIGYTVDYFSETLGLRFYDYSPYRFEDAETNYGRAINDTTIVSGGADMFLQFLTDKVIPFIDASYHTTDDRGIWGHSLSGLFAAYVLLKQNDQFDRYGISSGSLGWSNGKLLDLQKQYAERHDSLEASVVITVGEHENESLMEHSNRFYQELIDADYEGLSVTSMTLEDENHVTVVPAAISRAIRVLYGAAD